MRQMAAPSSELTAVSLSPSTPSTILPVGSFSNMQYFAFSPSGTLYADNVDESAFARHQEILSVTHGKTSSLWRHRVKN
jgi:hypothetical protein